MKNKSLILLILAGALVNAVGLFRVVEASTIEHMSLTRLAQTAPLIVRARCGSNSARWDGGEIWTITRMETEDVWKGGAPSQLSIRLLGGSVGNITSTVSGVPRFQTGEDVVLFLEPTKLGDFSIEGWAQGTFRIRHDAHTGRDLVTQDTASISTFDPRTRAFDSTGVRGVALDAFRAQVEAALSTPRGAAQ